MTSLFFANSVEKCTHNIIVRRTKKILICLAFLFLVFNAFFLGNKSPHFSLAIDYEKMEKTTDYREDVTEFSLTYLGKVWEFKCEDFVSDFKQFDINYEFNKFYSNNKNKKILIIKKLKKNNFENKLIIEYLFPKILNNINKISNNIEKQAKNAEIIINNKINIKKEINGIKIDYNKLFDLILNNYLIYDNFEIEIPTITIKPDVCFSELEKSTHFRASFSTSFASSSADRKHNIYQATKKINKTKIAPNERFSFNDVVGRRTIENGYRTAKIISQGEFVDGVGGGVCQVSTTLYNAVLKAGLKIIQANKHSEKISYVTTGFDSMVNYGSSDLIFENNTNHDIFILSSASGNKITFSIYGEDMKGVSYKLRNEILDEVCIDGEKVLYDFEKKYKDRVRFEDESFYLKRAKKGFLVKTYREKYLGDELILSELLRVDKYNAQQAVKVFGTEKRPSLFSASKLCVFENS